MSGKVSLGVFGPIKATALNVIPWEGVEIEQRRGPRGEAWSIAEIGDRWRGGASEGREGVASEGGESWRGWCWAARPHGRERNPLSGAAL